MAHKKGEGSTQNGRDSISKRLGVKLYGGQLARAGNIIIRQRGTKFHTGQNTYFGKDYTIHAKVDGIVSFRKGRRGWTFVSVLPFDDVQETVAKVEKPKKAKPAPKPVVEEPVAAAPEAPAKEETPAKEAPKAEAKAEKKEEPKAEKKAAKAPAKAKKDDLKKIEGIGPKIASILTENGIATFADLAAADPEKIREILVAQGSRYKMHDPTTWPQQAALAAEGQWDELKELQDNLKGGRTE